ncbi:hypothetical protein ACOSQ2_014679 [Xanthoceras sorbifolium]
MGTFLCLMAKAWIGPHDGLSFKLNTNAAIDSKGERIGLGAVIRGTNGNLCAAASVVAYRGLDVEVAEAKAIREGLSLVIDRGFWPLVVEYDASNVVICVLGQLLLDVMLLMLCEILLI